MQIFSRNSFQFFIFNFYWFPHLLEIFFLLCLKFLVSVLNLPLYSSYFYSSYFYSSYFYSSLNIVNSRKLDFLKRKFVSQIYSLSSSLHAPLSLSLYLTFSLSLYLSLSLCLSLSFFLSPSPLRSLFSPSLFLPHSFLISPSFLPYFLLLLYQAVSVLILCPLKIWTDIIKYF